VRALRVGIVFALLLGVAAPAGASEGVVELEGIAGGAPSGLPIDAAAVVHPIVFPVVGPNHYDDTFGACRDGCSRTHEGIDIMSDKMTPIIAVASGTVGWIDDERGGDCCAFALEHDDGWESYYIHMNNDTPGTDDGQGWGFAPWIHQGAHVEAGQLVGWVGDSGNAESVGSHLHYELHKPDGSGGHIVINPFKSLNQATHVGAQTIPGGVRGCDFDGDARHDIAIGAPGEDLVSGPVEDAGAVTILFGGDAALATDRAVVIKQSTPGVASPAEAGDRFGAATACGDFDGDGFDDLAVGAPGESFGDKPNVGAVNVLFGSADGLDPRGDDLWHQGRSGVPSGNAAGDEFGGSLTVGDFDGDGFADLAIGAPGETVAGRAGAGAVTILYGSSSGVGDRIGWFTRSTEGLAGSAAAGDAFGHALAAGDVDGDGKADLAIGIPLEDTPAGDDTGAVAVLFGSSSGIDASGDRVLRQGSHGIKGTKAQDERFGWSLAIGDVDGDRIEDLAIGVPGEVVGSGAVGGVAVILGSPDGPVGAGDALLRAGRAGMPGTTTPGGRFGEAVTMGDFNLDGYRDVAIGFPGFDGDAGAVVVVPSLWDGIVPSSAKVWSESKKGIKGLAAAGDELGAWLATGALGKYGFSSLVVGVPLKDKHSMEDAGAVHVVRGARKGLTRRGDQLWKQSSAGMPGSESAGDRWGHVVRAGT
jgi:Peptidase family M23/FG-GAP repeat